MALYIEDKTLFDVINTEQGIELIKNKILEYDKRINVETRHQGTIDEVILIQTLSMGGGYSNIVSLSTVRKSICVNPMFKKTGDRKINPIDQSTYEPVTQELKDYIEIEIPKILRDNKINTILNEQ